jgi:hypothetical protein
MAPLLCGFIGGLFGAYWGFKGEWPAVTIMVFACAGFAAAYGLALAVVVDRLSGI